MKCPDFDRLVMHLSHQLSDLETSQIAAHLDSGCKDCLANRDWYENVYALASSDESKEPPPWVLRRALKIFDRPRGQAPLIERLGRAVASLVFDSFAQPATEGVRSTETASRQLLYRAGDYHIDLQIAPSAEAGLIGMDLLGQVLREGETGFESVRGLQLELVERKAGGKLVSRCATDEMGGFTFSDVKPGAYDLQVKMSDSSITVSDLRISPSL